MSVIVEISNVENLRRLKEILGVNKDSEAIERSMERTIREYEAVQQKTDGSDNGDHDLPEEYWEDLFSEPMLPNNPGSQAVIDERNEARY
ncbi:MAG TPA: hypothetical protein PLK77_11925 [Pyrinomonadaceae bacterium]|nr:hypothetical protein [Pyrinomonadaceae bacterium]